MGRSTRGADYQDIPRPIAALSDEYPPGHHDPHHHHKRAQLIYACAGVTVVITDQASFVVPPQCLQAEVSSACLWSRIGTTMVHFTAPNLSKQ